MPNNSDTTQDFRTHYNYAKCMNGMMHEITMNIPLVDEVVLETNKVNKYIKLAKLTKNSIDNEIRTCNEEPAYTEVVAPWLPVKHYYRLYYLECVLIHLSQGNARVFLDGGHKLTRNMITSFCRSGYVSSRLGEAQEVVTIDDAISHRIRPGHNISANYYLTQECIKSVRAKIATYILEHWKINKGWARFSTIERRQQRDRYKANKYLCLLDYFYQMRLKANYGDLEFLRIGEISSDERLRYVRLYHSAAIKYANCLQSAISQIASSRNITIESFDE